MSSTTEFLDALEHWYRDLDRHLRRLPVVQEQSCSSCSHETPGCCTMKILVAFHEALPIARYLKRSRMDTPELRARLRELGDAMEGSPRKPWFESRRPCAFLAGGRCSVYAARPIACRSYFVTSAPANCQAGAESNVVRFVDNSEILATSIVRARRIHEAMGLKETNKRLLIGALPRLVLIALESWDTDDMAAYVRAQRWPTDHEVRADWLEGENEFKVAP